MNICKPMTYLQFKALPKDLQEEFLKFLKAEFNCNGADTANTFKIHRSSLFRYFKNSGIRSPFPKHPKLNSLDKERWDAFWAGKEWRSPENPSESDEKAHSEANDIPCEDTHNGTANAQKPAVEPEETVADCWNNSGKIFYEEQLAMAKARTEELKSRLNKLTGESGTSYPQIEIGHFVPAQVDYTVELKNVRNWNDIVRAASAFSLPENNVVFIQVTESDDHGERVGVCEMNHEEV
jgi:hypothetical protein